MAQINLLKQTDGGQRSWDLIPKILARFLFLVLALIVVYYAWLMFGYSQAEKQIATTQKKINDDRQAALNLPKRDETLTRQLQLKTQAGLISSHIYFSQLFPELARVTLKTASYSSLQATADGGMMLSASVPSVDDLDKYLQVFDLPAFNQNFSDIRIGGFHKAAPTVGGNTTLNFSVKMHYNPALLQYKQP